MLGPYATNRSGIDWTLNISLSYATNDTLWSPAYAPIVKESFPSDKSAQWLRGDFHMHTVYSDGRYLPHQQIANALSRDLDFIFFSEHNTDSGNSEIGNWIPANASELLIGRAIEVTTRHGHWQAIGLGRSQQVEWRYTNASGDSGYADAATQVHESGGLVSLNHPFQNCSRCDWTLDWEHHDAIEVWNGRYDPLDEVAVQFWKTELVAGKRVTAIGGSDAHSPPEINGLPTTVVRAEGEKSQASVVEGVKRGRVYLVEGPGMDLQFGVSYNGKSGSKRAEIGEAVPKTALDDSATASFSATGFDGATACFVNEKGYFHNASIGQQPIEQLVAGMQFVLVEVRNTSDILLGLTNPIYFT